MTEPERVRVVVPREETIALARAMAAENAQARRRLEPYLAGQHADLALPHVRREAKRILHDSGLLITRRLRRQIAEFGAFYGLQTRGRPGKADEPMAARFTVRTTERQKDLIEEAADKLNMTATDFMRLAAMDRAREVLGEQTRTGSESGERRGDQSGVQVPHPR